MDLLDSIKKIISFFKPGSILLIPVFLGCDAANDLGTQFDLETNIDVNVIELDFPATNVLIDSLRTDGEDRLVVGTFNDPLTGRITTETYFEYAFQSGILPGDTLEFDSAQITLSTAGILPISGSSIFDMDIYELEDTLLSGVIYLATKQERKSRQVGNLTTTISPTDEEIAFKLDDSYGREIFDILKNKPDTIGTASLFFKGLALTSGATNESLVSFDARADTSKLRIYMSGDGTTEFVEFSIRTSLHTYVERDRSTSPFSGIVERESFDLVGDGRTVLDPLAGITTSFNIESIKTFFDDNPNVLINTTVLDLVAEDLTDRDTLQGFNLYFRTSDGGFFGPGLVLEPFSNVVMTDQSYLSGSSIPAPVAFNPDTDQYIVTPTLFFQALYNNFQNWKDENGGAAPDNLFYVDPFLGDTTEISDMILVHPDQMILQQAIFQNSGIKLRIFFTDVN